MRRIHQERRIRVDPKAGRLVAGFLALLAAIGTIWATRSTASRQITAAREQADRMVAAAREQTRATFKQTETTFDLEQMREASEALAFHAMLEAAMARVLAEAAWARRTYPEIFADDRQARLSTPLPFASASLRARSRNCAPLASGGAAI